MKRSLSLSVKVTLAFVLFAAVLLLGLGFFAYNSGRNTLEAATFSGLVSTALEKQAAFDTWIRNSLTQVESLAASSSVQANILAFRFSANTSEMLSAYEQLSAELEFYTGQNGLFLDLLVLHPDTGRIIIATNPEEEGRFNENRPYFINGRNASYIHNMHYSLQPQGPAIIVSTPIRTTDGNLLGVLAGRLDLTVMSTIINRHADLYQTNDAFLVNTSHLFVTQPRFLPNPAVLQRGIYTEPVRRCLSKTSGTILANDYRGIPVVAVFRWLDERQLCLIVKMDQAEAFAPVDAFRTSLLFISGIALLASSALAVGLANTITRPILALQTGVTRFGQGELNIRLPETTGDELGTLAHEFNMMADAIVAKEALLHNYANELEQRVTERTRQLAFLAEASRLLSESFDYSVRLKALAQLAVPTIADWCTVDILEEDELLHRLAVVHIDPTKVELAYELQERYPPDPHAPRGAYNVMRTRQSEMYAEISDELLVASAKDAEQLAIVRSLGLKSALTVPLLARGRVFGTISFVMAESGRHYNQEDLALIEDLARRAALLIDNAKLYQQAQQLNSELEQRVVERTAQLAVINKELEAFSYSVSHDLRAPLRSMDGYSQALQEDYAEILDEAGQGFLKRIRASSQHMGQLIDDLLMLSQLTRQEIRQEPVNLSALAEQITRELREMYSQRSVEVVIQPSLTVYGDTRLLRVVFVNLLNNAWKFTARTSQARIEFGMNSQNGAPVYFLRDNGVGFDMAYADKLFGAFQRLHKSNEFEGTGIGLATVQRIIHRHGGQIWAEGAVNQGATFYFSFQNKQLG